MTSQARILDAVARRGYLNGYSPEQVEARQVVKAIEELAELAELVSGRFSGHDAELWRAMMEHVTTAGKLARRVFDEADWHSAQPVILHGADDEAVDLGVVLACYAGLRGFDLMACAADKAAADVVRGVR